jgi:perosamine synthetase
LDCVSDDDFSRSALTTDAGLRDEFCELFCAFSGLTDQITIPFASARMALVSFLKSIVWDGRDQVVVTGFSCAAVPWAVQMAGLKPVFVDVDVSNLGTSASGIADVISNRTLLVIAQHSFGFPCEIEEIQRICRKAGVPLLEDCALSFGSKLLGKPLGSFGDAAIFSFDHSKPVNLSLGGMLVINKVGLFSNGWSSIDMPSAQLSLAHQKQCFKQAEIERYWNINMTRGRYDVEGLCYRAARKLRLVKSPFLSRGLVDSRLFEYPDVAAMPNYAMRIGVEVFSKRSKAFLSRQGLYRAISGAFSASGSEGKILQASQLEGIAPLRISFCDLPPAIVRALFHWVDLSGVWFQAPLIGTSFPMSRFGYKEGCCPVAEDLGRRIINLPLNIDNENVAETFVRAIEDIFGVNCASF